MKIIVREKADADLDEIFAWIAKDNPAAAVAMIRRIRQRIGRLATPGLENMGRPGLDVGTREHWQLESEPAKVAPIMIKVVLGIGDVDLVGF
jgi:plasmid stabilization system protein ParE